jgi:AraC-like DNA-binding protein
MEIESFEVSVIIRTDEERVEERVGYSHQDRFRVDGMLVEFGPGRSAAPIVRNWSLGPLGLMLLEASNLSLTPDSAYTERFLYLAFIKSGAITVEANGEMLHLGAESMVLIDLEAPHIQRFDRHSEVVLLRVPRKYLVGRGFQERRIGLISPDMAAPDVRAVSEIVSMVGGQSGCTSHDLRRRQGEHLLDLFSVIVNDPSVLVSRRNSGATLLRAKRFISQNIGNVELNVSLVASAVCLSEAYLHRLFRAEGHSLMRYVLCHRLELAAELLTRRDERRLQIKEVAYRCGFSNHAHFSRSFKRRFGVSPKFAASTGLSLEPKSDDESAF